MFTYLMDHHDFVMFLLRFVVGIIFVYHGQAKLRKPEGMAQGLGWSKNVVLLLGLAEAAAGLGVITGILISWAALGMIIIMLGAIYYKLFKWKTPFWSMTSTGWEYDLILLVCALVIMSHGAESFALLSM